MQSEINVASIRVFLNDQNFLLEVHNEIYALCVQKKRSLQKTFINFIFFLISRENKKHSPTYHLVILPWVAEKICREMLDPEKKLVDRIRWIFDWGVSGGGIRWTFVVGGYQKTG